MELYDMHSHILPAFDDGAKTVEDSLKLIDSLKKQGVRNICLTPHYYSNERSLEDFVEKRQEAFEKFKPHIPDDINIVLGSEVYVTDYLFNNDDLSAVTYGNSRYILTEFPYQSVFTEAVMKKFYMLIENFGLIPVIPHVERYSYLMNHPYVIAQLQGIGVIIQTNAVTLSQNATLLGKLRLLKYIKRGLIDILGTDTHSMTHNTPEAFAPAMKLITEKCGRKRVEEMMNTSKKIFEAAKN